MSGFFDEVLEATRSAEAEEGWLAGFLGAPAPEALAAWVARSGTAHLDARALRVRLSRDVAELDQRIGRQLDRILHAPKLQRLEASWRNLRWLVERLTPGSTRVRIRVLDVSWSELAKDLDRAIEFDQSQAFRLIYTEEFGTPGGTPYSVLLGDYFVAHRPRPDQRVDDVRTLRSMSTVAAAAFAPFVVGAHPTLFGVDTLSELGRPLDLDRIFSSTEYVTWNALRDTEDARFLAVTLPRVLTRLPHEGDVGRADGFHYRERIEHVDDYLWGNACHAFGAVVLRSAETSGWPSDLSGCQVGVDGGGIVSELPLHEFGLDRPGTVAKPPTDLVVTDHAERAYGGLGLIALCACKDTPYAAFYSLPTLQRPKRHDRVDATRNAKLSALLQNILCVSRFAHYLKVLCRDREGSYADAGDIQKDLQVWLAKYTISGNDVPKELQAKHPLRSAQVQINEVPGKPGCYSSVIHLQPHMQFDQMTSSMRLVTEMLTK